jgi:esterase/lipase superfamily enzyme
VVHAVGIKFVTLDAIKVFVPTKKKPSEKKRLGFGLPPTNAPTVKREKFASATFAVTKDNIDKVPPYVVCREPDKYLELYLEHHKLRLPDMSTGRTMKPKKLQFWKNTSSTASLAAHADFPGVCAKWANLSIDFCMARSVVLLISKHTFAFQNPHLHFKTHICFSKPTFAFQNPHLIFKTTCMYVKTGTSCPYSFRRTEPNTT